MTHLLQTYADSIEAGLHGPVAYLEDPDLVHFDEVHAALERVEKAFEGKAFLDALFAYICERDGAGRMVGSPYASEYLKQVLGLSGAEAFSRLRRGKDLFAPPEPPPGDDAGEEPEGFDFSADTGDDDSEGASEGDPGGDAEGDAGKKARARSSARQVSDEKAKIIDRSLKNLIEAAQCERASILEKAMAEAAIRPPEDLRKYVDNLVSRANRKHKTSDPNAAWDQRGVRFSENRSTGVHTIAIDTTAAFAALFKAQLQAGLPANKNLPNEKELNAAGVTDPRMPWHRLHDEFVNILQNWEKHKNKDRKGAASLILSMTMDDLADADHTTTFQTNSGIDLNCLELVRLGVGGADDFILQLDRVTGVPVSLGRTRLAAVHQRIAMLAIQGVCAWEGCTRPVGELEIHHIVAHCQGGDTDLSNLIGLCRTHHRQNNDHRDGRDGRRHVERCPETGDVGVQYCDGSPLRVNQTTGHTESAGYKLRHRKPKVPAGGPPVGVRGGGVSPGGGPPVGVPPDPVLFPDLGPDLSPDLGQDGPPF
ncbi:HNH endonuclease signature motif containing protein [Corynebacterium riegelii]|uniref:HNH endonuclease signature motif containing protein n=1 Tax=Corynebacterium riegelii TaxID=156976 RepID=UPI0023EFF0E0|nr:HNH endonuclease signature motif containing protein [Corynebacterium riegelii]